jgi:hypothetical protein
MIVVRRFMSSLPVRTPARTSGYELAFRMIGQGHSRCFQIPQDIGTSRWQFPIGKLDQFSRMTEGAPRPQLEKAAVAADILDRLCRTDAVEKVEN